MILGIDTSCYTSSLAIISKTGAIDYERRILLSVKPGEKGLQQSTAIFQHLQNLPQLVAGYRAADIRMVAASVRPRPASDSYLPVFTAGASFGETIAKLLGALFVATSHQEGHIRAGLYDSPRMKGSFLAWHISGGTTELLLVNPSEGPGYKIQKIGGSSDLQIGQFIDRVGVALGTSFPAGPALEKLALGSDSTKSFPVVTQKLELSFSGPETAAQREIIALKGGALKSGNLKSGAEGEPAQEGEAVIARRVFNCVSRSLLKVTIQAVTEHNINRVLMVGGVASSEIIRDVFRDEGQKLGIQFLFGPRELASDNAVGVGLIGYDHFRGVSK